MLEIQKTVDVICPWCHIGLARLNRALETIGDAIPVKLVWRPFELNPDMPEGGISRREYRTHKWGSWEAAQAKDAHNAQVAAADGLIIDFDAIERTPNTLKAHRLIWLAGRYDLATPVAGEIMRRYFEEGQDIGQDSVLTDAAVASGLPEDDAVALLASDTGLREVRAMEDEAARRGVRGVPHFDIGPFAVSGAQTPDILARAILQADKVQRAAE